MGPFASVAATPVVLLEWTLPAAPRTASLGRGSQPKGDWAEALLVAVAASAAGQAEKHHQRQY